MSIQFKTLTNLFKEKKARHARTKVFKFGMTNLWQNGKKKKSKGYWNYLGTMTKEKK